MLSKIKKNYRTLLQEVVKMSDSIQLYENQPIRSAWDEEKEEWYFSVVDVIGILTEQETYDGAKNYWKVLKHRIKAEGNQLVSNCNQLKMKSPKDEKRYLANDDKEE